MTDDDWQRAPNDEQHAEFDRLGATMRPCTTCGKDRVGVINTLMSCLFSNYFRIECLEGFGGCGRRIERQRGHSGLVAVVKEWNDED